MSKTALPDLTALMTLSQRFEAAQSGDPALRGASLDALIRHIPGKRAILRGAFQGRPAVIRMFDDPADRAAGREWAEMTRIWPHMQSGDHRIAEPFHFNADHGILVIEDVPGTPLLEHIVTLDPDTQAGQLEAPAAWLRRYTAPTERAVPPNAGQWLARAEAQSATQPHPKLQRRERLLIKHLRRIVDAAGAQEWRSAICHGDFHPNNLILKSPRLTGIDLGGSSTLPICKDIARFLMHMGRRGIRPSGAAVFGVDRAGFEAFVTAFNLSKWEQEALLPFLLGVEALIRVESPTMSRGRIRRAAEMYDLLIADLAQV